MPDLATHLAAGYLLAETKPTLSRAAKTLFLTGNLLPDLLTRPFDAFVPGLYWAYSPLHSPVGLVLVCAVAGYLFEPRLRRTAFWALLLGSGLHLLLDSLQKRVVDVYGFLFPLAWRDIYLGLFWPDESLYLLPVLIVIICLRHYLSKKIRVPHIQFGQVPEN